MRPWTCNCGEFFYSISLNIMNHLLKFQCNWCPSANLCSTNEDLNKIKWKKSNCSQPGNCFDGFDLAKFGLDHCDVYDKKTTETPRIYEPETPPSRLELDKPPEVIKEEVEHRDTPIVFLAIVILAGLAFHLIICGCLIKACKDRKTTSGHLSKVFKDRVTNSYKDFYKHIILFVRILNWK